MDVNTRVYKKYGKPAGRLILSAIMIHGFCSIAHAAKKHASSEYSDDNRTLITADKSVSITCELSSKDFFGGHWIKIGDKKGAVALKIRNSKGEDLSIGRDIYIWVNSGSPKLVYLLNDKGLTDENRRKLQYATLADYFTALDNGKMIVMGFNAWGQQFQIDDSMGGEMYKGIWNAVLPASGKAEIRQQLITWPGSDTGWVATPVLSGSGEKENGVRVVGEFAANGTVADPKVIIMDTKTLSAFAKDTGIPLDVRQWSVGWLAELADNSGAGILINILKDKQMPPNLRKSAARWLAVKHPAAGLSVIEEVMWSKTVDADLQKACYYAFDWALLPDENDPHNIRTWECITRATGHPDAEISAVAKKKVAGRSKSGISADKTVEQAQPSGRQVPQDKSQIPALTKALSDPDPAVRANAASALGEIGPEAKSAVPGLVKLFSEDGIINVRTNAANALRKIGPEAKSAVPALIKLLSEDSDDEVRGLAVFVLGGIGPEAKSAVPALTKLLSDDHITDLRAFAAMVLGEIGPEARSAIPELTKLTGESDDKVRDNAAKALKLIDKNAVPARSKTAPLPDYHPAIKTWISQLNDPDWQIRCRAAFELGKAKADEAVDALLGLLDDENEKVRGVSALALGRIRDRRALTPLIERLQDKSSYIRESAAKALGNIGDKRAVKPLKAMLKDEAPQVRKAVRSALQILGSKQRK